MVTIAKTGKLNSGKVILLVVVFLLWAIITMFFAGVGYINYQITIPIFLVSCLVAGAITIGIVLVSIVGFIILRIIWKWIHE